MTTSADSRPDSHPDSHSQGRGLLHWLAAGLGSGWLPRAPGTWGTLAAVLPGWLLLDVGGPELLLLAAVTLLIMGCAICARLLPRLPDKDPGWVVVDEWVGLWVCMAIVAPLLGETPFAMLLSFAAFRFFDIAKPWPVSWSERVGPAWWSIMADDVVAGIMGGAAIWLGTLILGSVA